MKIGPYEIQEELARGGQGIVYRAVDERAQRPVVLKLLKADSVVQRRRLQREAQAMAQLQHPHLVAVHDLGTFAGKPYIVLPYVAGESLQERVDRGGPVSVREALRWTAEVAQGLQAAHAIGLVHRDVKPANVLLTTDERALLTDFGLVKNVDPQRSQTQGLSVQGQFMGTPGYWPPEQARGEHDTIGPSADVYALGALLYAVLTGSPPRDASGLQAALMAFERPLAPVSDSRPGVPEWIERLIAACLEFEPQRRPTVGEVLVAIERGDFARPAVRRGTFVLATAIAMAALGGGLLTVVFARSERSQGRVGSAALPPAEIPSTERNVPEPFVLPQTLREGEPVLGAFVDGELIVATPRHLQAWDGHAWNALRQVALLEGYFQPCVVFDLGQGRALLGGIGRQPLAVWSATGLRNYAAQNVRGVARQGPFLAYGTGDGVVGVLRVTAGVLEDAGATLNVNPLHAEGEPTFHVRNVVWLSPTRLLAIDRAHVQPDEDGLSELAQAQLELRSSLHLLGWDPVTSELEHLDSLEVSGGESLALRESEPRIVVGTSTGALLHVRVDATRRLLSKAERVFFGLAVPVSVRGLAHIEGDLCLAALQVHRNLERHDQYNGLGVFEGDRPLRVLQVDGISPRSLAVDRESRQLVLFGHYGQARVLDLDWVLEAAVEPK